ncbi:hypothetical protein H8790_02625 [Oscillibacter hominis]|uniref:Uncharacterized protein n=1 Tax=Oscillibacter hominis TaxID=2763056 RepID=A0A7G9B5X4_9FIRM|nr:hypothetical protein [Oscillibacter hominis]QNL44955.1 hypothetical protein H8790_02625 [Oscillibacter hominis]
MTHRMETAMQDYQQNYEILCAAVSDAVELIRENETERAEALLERILDRAQDLSKQMENDR